MYTVGQVKNGLVEFIGQAVIPHLTGAKRYGATLYMALAADAVAGKIHDIAHNPAIQMLGVLSDDGSMVDVDRLHAAMIQSMDQGKIDLQVPLLGTFTFNRHDVDQLFDHIMRQA